MSSNLIWTALTEGQQYPDVPYSRHGSPEAYLPNPSVTDVLHRVIPQTDLTRKLKYTDEFIKLLFLSQVAMDAHDFDPLNSYCVVLAFPETDPVLRVNWGSVILTLEGLQIPFRSKTYRDIWVSKSIWTDRVSAVILDLSKQLIV